MINIKEVNNHKEVFGIEPVIIGLFRYKHNELIDNIQKAIIDNKPYNEYELLSEEEKKAFDNGKLLF